VNWFWPQKLNEDDRVVIRIVRVLHWGILGVAAFCFVVSFIGLMEAGDAEPITYFAVGFVWFALAMLGRAVRYVVARE
jgi:hypothetical protein